MSNTIREFSIVVPESDDGRRIRKFLTQKCKHIIKSKEQLHRAFERLEISVNDCPVEETRLLKANDEIVVRYDTSHEEEGKLKSIPVRICYEDDYVAVVWKPSGQTFITFTKAICLKVGLKNEQGQRKEIWCINEIQKAASGLILVAKTEEVRDVLLSDYDNNKLQVTMRVLCHGLVSSTDVSVLFDTDTNKKEQEAEPIILSDVLKQITIVSHTPSNNAQYISKLNLDLCTPLSSIKLRKLFYFHSKHPIIGNSKFTKPLRVNDKGLCASLISISFQHPIQKDKIISINESEPAKFQIMCDREAKFFKSKMDREEEEIKKSGVVVDMEERKDGELLAYILGQKEFCGHNFKISKDCLIPRASSETLVRASVDVLRNRNRSVTDNNTLSSLVTSSTAAFRIIDIGTGCGNILISILKELPLSTGVGIDVSEAALALAKENSNKLLSSNINGSHQMELGSNPCRAIWRVQDMASLKNGDTSDRGAYDLLVCNPPYLDFDKTSKKKDQMMFLEQEPAIALFAKEKGLEWYHVLHEVAPVIVKQDGFVVLECGKDMLKDVLAIWSDWEHYRVYKDSQGWDRCLVLKRESLV